MSPNSKDMGIPRTTWQRAVEALEGAQLASVDRGNGRNPFVTLLDVNSP